MRGAPVMTVEVIQQARQFLAEGYSEAEVARQLDVPYDTLRKAIDQGRLPLPDSSEEAAADTDGDADAGGPPAPGTPLATAEYQPSSGQR